MPGIKVHDGSSWSSSFSSNMRIHDGSTWRPALKGWVHDGTNWNQFYPSSPVNTVQPQVTSSRQNSIAVQVGDTLSVNTGTWSGSPTSYSYQWYSNEGIFAGQTSSTFNIAAQHVPYFGIGCYVTATNSSGSTTATALSSFFSYPVITGQRLTRIDSSSFRVEFNPIQSRWNLWAVEVHAMPSPPGNLLQPPFDPNTYKWGSDILSPSTQSAQFFHNGLLYAIWLNPYIGATLGNKGTGLGWTAVAFNQTN